MVCLPVSFMMRFNESERVMFTTIGESQVNNFGHRQDNIPIAVLLTNDKWWNCHIV